MTNNQDRQTRKELAQQGTLLFKKWNTKISPEQNTSEPIYSEINSSKKTKKIESSPQKKSIELDELDDEHYAQINELPPSLPERAYTWRNLNKQFGTDIFTKPPKEMTEEDIKKVYLNIISDDVLSGTFYTMLPKEQKRMYDSLDEFRAKVQAIETTDQIVREYSQITQTLNSDREGTIKRIDLFREFLNPEHKLIFLDIQREKHLLTFSSVIQTELNNAKSFLGRDIFQSLGSITNEDTKEQLEQKLKAEPIRVPGESLPKAIDILLPILTETQREKLTALKKNHKEEINNAEKRLEELTQNNSSADGKKIAQERGRITEVTYKSALDYANKASALFTDPAIKHAIAQVTTDIKSYVDQNTLDLDKNMDELRTRANTFISDSILKSLSFNEFIGKPSVQLKDLRASVQKLTIPITEDVREFFIKNATEFKGTIPLLQNVVVDIFGQKPLPTEIPKEWANITIDPAKLKDQNLQDEFTKIATKHIQAFVLTQKVIQKSALDPSQAEKATKVLVPTLRQLNLSKLTTEQTQELINYTAEKLKNSVTFLSSLKASDKKISEAKLEDIASKIKSKYKEPIIYNIIKESNLKLNQHQKEKVEKALGIFTELNPLSETQQKEFIKFSAKKIRETTSLGSKLRRSDQLKTEKLQNITNQISDKYKELYNQQESQRKTNDGWDKALEKLRNKTLDNVNYSQITQIIQKKTPPPITPRKKSDTSTLQDIQQNQSTIIPTSPITQSIKKIPPPVIPRKDKEQKNSAQISQQQKATPEKKSETIKHLPIDKQILANLAQQASTEANIRKKNTTNHGQSL